ncbi:thioredoxin family protein [Persicimonas caeni]|nr:thioredoxin family protein [Persicimonas caeni]
MDFDTFQELRDEHRLLVVYVSGPSCSVCDALGPKLAQVMDEHAAWRFVKIDAAEDREVAGQMLVLTVPTLVFFVDGREAARLTRSFGMQEVRGYLERYEDAAG